MTVPRQIKSSSEPGLRSRNFQCVAKNGFGDPGNAYPHSMAWFRDHLYVGTTRHNLAQRGVVLGIENARVDYPINMAVWPVELPKSFHGIFDYDMRGQIWRYDPKTENWQNVYKSETIMTPDGFEAPVSFGFRNLVPFQCKGETSPALYAPTWGTSLSPPTMMLRTYDGENFESVSQPGLGLGSEFRGARPLVEFKGRLFIAPVMGRKKAQACTADTMSILVNADPAREEWKMACGAHFGDPGNRSVYSMCVFNEYLYAGTLNIKDGFQVWKTDGDGKPPFRWTKVISQGAYRGRLNQAAFSMSSFNGQLYIGSGIQSGGFDREYNVGPAAPEVIRVYPDDSWELITGTPRITPEGLKIPLSGFEAGFGNMATCYMWAMGVHKGWLYLGTAVWSPFLKFYDWNQWPRRANKIIDSKNFEKYISNSGGFDMWRTRDGVRWMPVTLDGFDNPYNIGIRNFVSTPHGLYVGVANSFGPRVAVKRAAGWIYENNKKGGLEIWLGDHPSLIDQKETKSRKGATTPVDVDLKMVHVKEKTGNAASFVSRFFKKSDFRHVGYWNEKTHDGKTACENLMEEFISFLQPVAKINVPTPPSEEELKLWLHSRISSSRTDGPRGNETSIKGKILDLCCKAGATTRYLIKYFSTEDIVGVTFDKKEIEACRKNVPDVHFQYMPASKLKLPGETFDYVICVEGLVGLNKKKLLQEIFHLLKPGGQMVFSDILWKNNDKRTRFFQKKKPIPIKESIEYKELLKSMGFGNIQIVDATSACWGGFQKHVSQYLELKMLASREDPDQLKQEIPFQFRELGIVSHYLLISGKKNKR